MLGMQDPQVSTAGQSLLQFVRAEPLHQEREESEYAASQSSRKGAPRMGQVQSPRKRGRNEPDSHRNEPDSHGQSQGSEEQQRNADVIEASATSLSPGTSRRRLEDILEPLHMRLDEGVDVENLGQIDLTKDDEEEEVKRGTDPASTPQKSVVEQEVTKASKSPDSPGPWWKTLLPTNNWKTNTAGNTWLPKASTNLFFKIPTALKGENTHGKSRNRVSTTTHLGRKELPKKTVGKDKKSKRPSLIKECSSHDAQQDDGKEGFEKLGGGLLL